MCISEEGEGECGSMCRSEERGGGVWFNVYQ